MAMTDAVVNYNCKKLYNRDSRSKIISRQLLGRHSDKTVLNLVIWWTNSFQNNFLFWQRKLFFQQRNLCFQKYLSTLFINPSVCPALLSRTTNRQGRCLEVKVGP